MLRRLISAGLAVVIVFAAGQAPAADGGGWTEQQVTKLPKSEKVIRLFDGKTVEGWDGQKDKYFSVKDGIIVGKNSAENAPKASTYLVTTNQYKNFRLIFESKLVESEMHTGIALWGRTIEMEGDPFSYKGHLVMYPSDYGYHDLFGRKNVYLDTEGKAKAVGKQHDWNRMEILAIGARIKHAINGKLVADWTDPMPETCQPGPIGLQLHRNSVAQEVQWRGLVMTVDPEDKMVTVE